MKSWPKKVGLSHIFDRMSLTGPVGQGSFRNLNARRKRINEKLRGKREGRKNLGEKIWKKIADFWRGSLI